MKMRFSLGAMNSRLVIYAKAMDLSNLGVIAPHKAKYYERYNIDWLIRQVNAGTELNYVTFWRADEGERTTSSPSGIIGFSLQLSHSVCRQRAADPESPRSVR